MCRLREANYTKQEVGGDRGGLLFCSRRNGFIYGLTPLPPTSLGLETRTLNMRPAALGCSKSTCGGRADHNVQVPVEIEAIWSKMHFLVWMLRRCPAGAPQVPRRCCGGAPEVPRRFRKVTQRYPGRAAEVPWRCPGGAAEVPQQYRIGAAEVPRRYPGGALVRTWKRLCKIQKSRIRTISEFWEENYKSTVRT